jgi:hypothetical protein
MKTVKKETGTREIKNNIEMVLKGHDHNGKEIWITAEYRDRIKSNEKRNK